MLKTLIAIPEKCTGCHRCEMWCSMKQKGVINIERAAIHVLRREPSIDDPRVCLQCGLCIGSCPKDLITRNKKTGAVEIDTENCTLCTHCILSCPYGMITIDPIDRHAVKCNLCGGHPECVKHCREEAILYVDADKAAWRRREVSSKRYAKEGKEPNIRQLKVGWGGSSEMDYFGYMGKVCRVDLTTGTISIEPLVERDLERFLGCSGYAAKILWDGLGAKVDPLSEKNKIVFATGPLTGSLCPSGGSYELCFKSPLTGVWCQARSGGAFGPRIKKAGFDHLVIEGKSDRPVYLWIRNGKVEIREAGHLWGRGVNHATDVILREAGDPDASVAAIGVAGENLVHFAAVINDRGRAAGRGGGGCSNRWRYTD